MAIGDMPLLAVIVELAPMVLTSSTERLAGLFVHSARNAVEAAASEALGAYSYLLGGALERLPTLQLPVGQL